MGIISITQRSEQLGNIGSTGMAHGVTNTDIGTVHHTVAGVFSPRYYAKHSHDGDAAIAHGLSNAAGVFAAISMREDERNCDRLVRQVIQNIDAMDRDDRPFTPESVANNPDMKHVLGEQDADGNYLTDPQKRGIRLRTGDGVKTIVRETDDTFAQVFGGIADGMDATTPVREKARERLSSYQRGRLTWAMDRQAEEYRRMELQGAKDQLSGFIGAWKNGNDAVLGDIFQAREKLGVLDGKTSAARKLDGQNLSIVLANDLIMKQIDRCQSREDFDDLEKSVKEDPKLPKEIAERLPDGKLGGKNQDEIVSQLRKAKTAYCRQMEQSVRENATDLETEMISGLPDPDQSDERSVAEHHAKLSAGYASILAANPQIGEWAPAKYRLFKRLAQKEQAESIGSAQKAVGTNLLDVFNSGVITDATGTPQPINAGQMADIASDLYGQGLIDRQHYIGARRISQKQLSVDAQLFQQKAFSGMESKFPNFAKFSSTLGQYVLNPSKKVNPDSKTGLKRIIEEDGGFAWFDRQEPILFSQYIDAANHTIDMMGKKGWTVDEAVTHFQKLVQPTVDQANKKTLSDTVKEEHELEEAYRRVASPSSQTEAPFSITINPENNHYAPVFR